CRAECARWRRTTARPTWFTLNRYALLYWPPLPDVRNGIPGRGVVRLRSVPRPPRGDLRLRRDWPRGDARAGQCTPGKSVAVPRTAARDRATHGLPLGLHTTHQGRSSGSSARRARAVRQGRLGESPDVLV